MRNNKTNRHFGIISTNPDINWIKTDFLLKSHMIVGTSEKYHQEAQEINPAFSTHVAKTSANTYLPDDYVDSISKNKPDWWVDKMLTLNSFKTVDILPKIA